MLAKGVVDSGGRDESIAIFLAIDMLRIHHYLIFMIMTPSIVKPMTCLLSFCNSLVRSPINSSKLLPTMPSPLNRYLYSQSFACVTTTSSRIAMSNGVENSSSSGGNDQQQPQASSHQVFQGHKTKVGKRRRKRQDVATSNARVRNSYLKLSLDESVFNSLHQLICQTKDHWDSSSARQQQDHHHQQQQQQQQQQDTVSKKQGKRYLTIKPRSLSSLHMTYFFCGKVLDEMSSDELRLWNMMVRDCLAAHNRNRSDNTDDSTTSLDEYRLQFKGLQLFPPNKNYLIVAVFESSSKLDGLYEELCNLAAMKNSMQDGASDDKTYIFPLLSELTARQHSKRNNNNSPSWVAHVTLGNISGGNTEDIKRLSTWIEDHKHQSVDSLLGNDIKVNGLSLGGPIPSHVDLDWDFPVV